jgi:hypothetical protein
MESTHSGNRTRRSSAAGALAKLFTCFCALAFLGSIAQVRAQESDKRIEEIKRLYKQINQQITASEREKPYSAIFCDELVLNRNENPWPAVGIYRSVIQAYYTFLHEEGEPYPNRLLQITVSTKRSDRGEYAEYLFNPAGQLVFCFEKKGVDPTVELRYYFANGRAIRITRDQKSIAVSAGAESRAAREVMKEGLKLKRIFTLGRT